MSFWALLALFSQICCLCFEFFLKHVTFSEELGGGGGNKEVFGHLPEFGHLDRPLGFGHLACQVRPLGLLGSATWFGHLVRPLGMASIRQLAPGFGHLPQDSATWIGNLVLQLGLPVDVTVASLWCFSLWCSLRRS